LIAGKQGMRTEAGSS